MSQPINFDDYRSEYIAIPIEEIESLIEEFFGIEYKASEHDPYFCDKCPYFADVTKDSEINDDDTYEIAVEEWVAGKSGARIEQVMLYLADREQLPYGEYLLWN